jgi:hypothetical protein
MPRDQTTYAMIDRCTEAFAEGGALDAVIARIRQLSAEVEGPELDAEPALRAVGIVLRDRLLRPIEDLLG